MKKIFKKIIVSILIFESRLVLLKYKPKIVAVTGSVGKTTTKDTIFSVLSSSFFVRKSEKSFNSEIGVPLSILGCDNGANNPFKWLGNIFEGLLLILFKNHYPKWLVLEVGADHPGDIEYIAKWLNPDIVVITRFADIPVHVEYFKKPADIIEEKKKLVKYMKKDGFLILNYDDRNVYIIKEEFNKKTISYGLIDGAKVFGSNVYTYYENEKPKGITFKVDYEGSTIPIKILGVLGESHVYPALAAFAVGSTQGLNLVAMSQALSEKHEIQPGRMKIIEGIKGSTIIDDSYNSSPVAVNSALRTLGDIETKGRKIAVLGDMMELGEYSSDEHKKVGEMATNTCHMLVTVGLRSRDTATGALNAGMKEENIFQFEDSQKAGAYLQNIIEKEDVILVKGSRWAMRMERTVEEIMARPERADELLVR
jgi:UDP-N-acetylmuramoyl-tripeptide--D-alanyl-D-alanine ligase